MRCCYYPQQDLDFTGEAACDITNSGTDLVVEAILRKMKMWLRSISGLKGTARVAIVE